MSAPSVLRRTERSYRISRSSLGIWVRVALRAPAPFIVPCVASGVGSVVSKVARLSFGLDLAVLFFFDGEAVGKLGQHLELTAFVRIEGGIVQVRPVAVIKIIRSFSVLGRHGPTYIVPISLVLSPRFLPGDIPNDHPEKFGIWIYRHSGVVAFGVLNAIVCARETLGEVVCLSLSLSHMYSEGTQYELRLGTSSLVVLLTFSSISSSHF